MSDAGTAWVPRALVCGGVRRGIGWALLLFATALTGCATVTGGGNRQELRVIVSDATAPLLGTACTLNNRRGQWSVKAPGYVTVATDGSDLQVRCVREGMEAVEAQVRASARSATAGNAIIGGLAGATIDVASGAAFRYPPVVILVGRASGTPASELQALSALRAPQVGDELEYRLVDRFTGLSSSLNSRISQVGDRELVRDQGAWRRGPDGVTRLGGGAPVLAGLEGLEPPLGWLPADRPVPIPRQAWRGVHEGRDGHGHYRFDWSAQVQRQERLAVPGGVFLATVVSYDGSIQRQAVPSVTAHSPTHIELWIEPVSRAVLRMTYRSHGGGGAIATGMQADDVYELVAVRRGGVDVRNIPPGSPLVADAQLPWRDLERRSVSLEPWRPGARLQYRVTDRYTGNSRDEALTLSQSPQGDWQLDHGRRILAADRMTPRQRASSPRLGDYEVLEPPMGWTPVYLEQGMRWPLQYSANDGALPSTLQLEAEVLDAEPLETAQGPVTAWKLRFTGTAMRQGTGATVPMPHRVVLELWREFQGPQVLRFSSDIRPDGGLSGMPSRELIEWLGMSSQP